MIGALVIAGYVVLALAVWPWGALAGLAHLALLLLFVKRR